MRRTSPRIIWPGTAGNCRRRKLYERALGRLENAMNATDSRMPVQLVLRDVAVVALGIVLWQWSHVLHDNGTTGATAVAIIAGLLLPVSAYFVHEWGHLSDRKSTTLNSSH